MRKQRTNGKPKYILWAAGAGLVYFLFFRKGAIEGALGGVAGVVDSTGGGLSKLVDSLGNAINNFVDQITFWNN